MSAMKNGHVSQLINYFLESNRNFLSDNILLWIGGNTVEWAVPPVVKLQPCWSFSQAEPPVLTPSYAVNKPHIPAQRC